MDKSELIFMLIFWKFSLFLAVLGLCCCLDFSLVAAGATLHCPVQVSHCVASLVVSTGSTARELSCSATYGIFPDQHLNQCLLHWQADSLPLSHRETPMQSFLMGSSSRVWGTMQSSLSFWGEWLVPDPATDTKIWGCWSSKVSSPYPGASHMKIQPTRGINIVQDVKLVQSEGRLYIYWKNPHVSGPAKLKPCSWCIIHLFIYLIIYSISIYYWTKLGFPDGINGKEPTCQCRRHKRCWFDPWVRRIP